MIKSLIYIYTNFCKSIKTNEYYFCIAFAFCLISYTVVMCYSERSIIYAFIWCSAVSVVFAVNNCFPNADPEVFNWENDGLEFPDILNYTQFENQNSIAVRVNDTRDNVTLTVYVNPYVNASTNCTLKKPSNSENLYKFQRNLTYEEGDTNTPTWILPKAVNGCYYAKLTNTTGHHIMKEIGAKFNKITHFYDWNLKFEKNQKYGLKPGDNQTPARYVMLLTIPQACLKIKIKLFRVLDANSCEKEVIGNCMFTNVTESDRCVVLKHGLDFKVNWNNSSNTEHWEAEITWNNLTSDKAQYASELKFFTGKCSMSFEDMATWVPAYNGTGLFNVGSKGDDNGKTPISEAPGKWREYALGSLLVVILATILIYWIRIWIRASFRRKNHGTSQLEQGREEIAISDSAILLMYVKGSPESIEKIMYYQDRLKKKCHHRVYSIHSINGPTMFENLGLTAWVENMMKVNSKFVWFDTPEFRSYLQNDSGQENHRNLAIPYAIRMTKTVFQHVSNQYRQHFVVRIEGLDVSDGKEDPLFVISPSIRYHLPQHFDALCTDLNE